MILKESMMKAQAFLELVTKTMTAQADYYAARRRDAGVITTRDLLIKSKDLEKQVWAVIKEGRLEPDEPTALDFVAVQRPNEPEQKPLFTEDGNE
jgi:hypothetical protein